MRPLATILASLVVVALPSLASAQAIAVPGEAALPRLDRDGNLTQKRPLTLSPEGINRHDCLAEQQIRIPIQLSGFEANASLEAWATTAGVDCASQVNRSGPAARCWPIQRSIPLQSLVTIDVPVRALVAGAPPFGPAALADGPIACGAVDLVDLSLQLLYFAPGQLATAAATKTITIAADTVGPRPIRELRVLPGDGRVRVDWVPPADASFHAGVDVYCEEIPQGSACVTESLLPGATPDPALGERHKCGSLAGNTGTTVLAFPLENRKTYGVGLAMRDGFDNPGQLSPITCATPEPQPGDGSASASSCAAGHRATPGGAAPALLLLPLALVAARRRQGPPPTSKSSERNQAGGSAAAS